MRYASFIVNMIYQQYYFLLSLSLIVHISFQEVQTWDENGYVLFCLCMGRLGNQIEHFLGGMAFAEQLNRTLVLPPFRTYKNVPFREWFKVETISAYHRVIEAETFMATFAEEHWPKGSRYGFCWLPSGTKETECAMKEGSPFGPFWDGLGVDFDKYVIYHITYQEQYKDDWNKFYPASKYPVIAMKGAPASFPIQKEHRRLQRYLKFADKIERDAVDYIRENFDGQKFVGIHLRNGPDWENTCRHADNAANLMASPQCLESSDQKLSQSICLPAVDEVLRLLRKVVLEVDASIVFIATDKNPLIAEITDHLADLNVKVFHKDPWLPLDDWAMLIKSDHFIGNCVSSFTSFVKRARDIEKKPSSFWGIS